MANELSTNDQAVGLPDLAQKALSLLFSKTDVVVAELGADAPAAIAAAVDRIEWEMTPVPADGARRGEWESAMHERLRRLAVKVNPNLSPAQSKPWQDSMIEALSDLPAMIALTAAKKAIHTPMRFFPDVEIAVREIAAGLIDRRRARRIGLEQMRREIERAMRAPLALPAPEDPKPITRDQIRKMNADLRALGLRVGFLTQAEIDEADADDIREAE